MSLTEGLPEVTESTLSRAKDFFINADQQEVADALKRYETVPENIPSPFIAVLVQTENKKLLIDTGVGFSEKPVKVRDRKVMLNGRLPHLLLREGIKKEDITDVIITHLHPDHIGGVYTADEQANFPSARFHLHQDEWDYWHTAASAS